MAQGDSFLGKGWGFPVTFSKSATCSVRMVSEVEDIRECLMILFSTRPRERVMRPDFGSTLEDLLFEPFNASLNALIQELIHNAVLYYEPRIDLEQVIVDNTDTREGQVAIELTAVVRSTNSRFNFVFPFYLNEATIAQ